MDRVCARGERFDIKLPPLESMHAVQSALTQLAEAIAAGAKRRPVAGLRCASCMICC